MCQEIPIEDAPRTVDGSSLPGSRDPSALPTAERAAMTVQERRAGAAASIGVVVVTHRARQHLHALPAAPAAARRCGRACWSSTPPPATAPSSWPAQMGAETLVVPRPAIQPRPHPRAGAPAPRHASRASCSRPTPIPLQDDFLDRLTAAGARRVAAAVAYGRQVAGATAPGCSSAPAARSTIPPTATLRSAGRLGRATAATPASARTPAPPGRTRPWTRSAASSRRWSPRRPSPSPSCWHAASASPTSPRPWSSHSHRL